MPLSVSLPAERGYAIHFAALEEVPGVLAREGLRQGRCLVVTDENVAVLYKRRVCDAFRAADWTPRGIVLPAGEATKGPDALRTIYDTALGWGIDRQTPVIALGGGVVGDLAGFAAATLLRGLPLVQLPTTLVAQVDSAIGGKTGINHTVGKNLVGAFHQPRAVVADRSVLETLPEREWTSGLAEVAKHALIADRNLFGFLQRNWSTILERMPDAVRETVSRAAAVKVRIVSRDEKEHGLRTVLNFGHTFAHAIERTAGYGRYTHGEAVALGMRAALHVSRRLHADPEFECADRLLRRIPIPEAPSFLGRAALTAAMRADKKVQAGRVRLVLLRRLGEAYVTEDTPPEHVAAAWAHIGVLS